MLRQPLLQTAAVETLSTPGTSTISPSLVSRLDSVGCSRLSPYSKQLSPPLHVPSFGHDFMLPEPQVSMRSQISMDSFHEDVLSLNSGEAHIEKEGAAAAAPVSFLQSLQLPARFAWKPPLEQRFTTSRQRRQVLYVPGGPGACNFESLSFPHSSECHQCGCPISSEEARFGLGLCSGCLGAAPKHCLRCRRRLSVKVVQWGSGLCKACYDACEKRCKVCHASLAAAGQKYWGAGLCNGCYNRVAKKCKICHESLTQQQQRWRTGLCDICYDHSARASCTICGQGLGEGARRWSTGMCDSCYDGCQKQCRVCCRRIPIGSLRWRTEMCNDCWNAREKRCKFCNKSLLLAEIHNNHGLCQSCKLAKQTFCKVCKQSIPDSAEHWGTGLCDSCYDSSEKTCKMCKDARVSFGQQHWGSGLCEACYTRCEKECRMCRRRLELGELHWGTRLCDVCFDSCQKQCADCQQRMDIGHLRWGTGLCDACYDVKQKDEASAPGLSSGVRATIAAQMVFYMAPEMLRPSLFLQIRDARYQPDAATCFAAVLITGSALSMLAPLVLGLWADCRGEREVYAGISLAAAAAALLFASGPDVLGFAAAWAIINGPPAIRGVRAAYFAKSVAPEELSRAGQLASSAGLVGGFVGPFFSAAFAQAASFFRWRNGFTAASVFAATCCTACAMALHIWMEPPKKKHHHQGAKLSSTRSFSQCDKCQKMLQDRERSCAMALCDACYDSFGGDGLNFKWFARKVLVTFCIIAGLLEVSMNAAVIAAFQPIAVQQFGWGNDSIAAVNFAGAALSVVVSLSMAQLRLEERLQMSVAAGLYLLGVLTFALPPLVEWRMVVGYMCGIKAQILFMAPFTAIFSRLIGNARVTNWLTTVLCLAPALGAAVGTAIAPLFIDAAGSSHAALLVALPALVADVVIAIGWHDFSSRPAAQARGILFRSRPCLEFCAAP